MTGFGRASFEVDGPHFDVEVRSVNHRYLNTRVRLPRLIGSFEAEVRSRIQSRFDRGKIDLSVNTPGGGAPQPQLDVDIEAVRQYVKAAAALQAEAQVEGTLNVNTLLALPGVARFDESEIDVELLRDVLFGATDAALDQLDSMRCSEGEALERDLQSRLGRVGELTHSLEGRAGEVQIAVRARLRKRAEQLEQQGDIKFEIPWTTLSQYLEHLVERGIATNVASFIGATTVRVHEVGFEDRPPNAAELERMRGLVRQAMLEGALGLGSSLIYAPAFYARTDELIELAKVAGEYGGMYISHMRSEGNRLLQAVEELITISREAELPAEIYHLKAAGEANWSKMDEVIARVEAARADGLRITADMYTYTAGATGLDAAMPPWVQEGGHDAWVERLRDPAIRSRVEQEMRTPTDEWENLYLAAGTAENVLLVGFRQDSLKYLTGKTLAEVASERGTTPEATAMDLVVADDSRVGTVYFLMSEENIGKQIALPWVSFGSDAGSLAPEGVFLGSNPHPRAYGNFARLLGRYVRDRQIISLAEAVRRLSGLPADNLSLRRRGRLAPGFFADVVVFDPARIQDHATFSEPHQFSEGVHYVLVNGSVVLRDGEPTGATPGRVVRGPGWTGW
ncbi:MAG: amidohydrolase family protein [Gemmatimonadetes bacterium]|nr:amidohydrolase family protein [Gemmatimonadota bacterium]